MKEQYVHMINALMILIICVVLSYFVFRKPSKAAEKFAQPSLQQVALEALNSTNAYCNRNLKFPNLNNNDFLASSRSIGNAKVADTGICNIIRTNASQDQNFSILHENYLYYTLRSACMKLNIFNMVYQNDGSVLLYVDRSTTESVSNLGSLLLLNPLFFEFSIDTNATSIAYIPKYDTTTGTDNFNNFSSDISTTPFLITLQPIAFVKFFDYNKTGSKSYKKLADLTGNKVVNTLNISVFYLDSIEPSSQDVGRKINIVYDPKNGVSNVFSSGFLTYKNVDTKTQEYHFCNHINLFHMYKVPPVFTVKFSFISNAKIPDFTWSRIYTPFQVESDKDFATRVWNDLTDIVPDTNRDLGNVFTQLVKLLKNKDKITREQLPAICQKIIKVVGTQKVKPLCYVAPPAAIGGSTTVMRMFMGATANSAIGFYGNNCQAGLVDTLAGPQNNNIFMVVATITDNHYRLTLMTGGNNTCETSATNDSIFIDVPYTSTSISVMATVSPYEKILVAYWNYSDSSEPNYVMSRRRNCQPSNNFFKLFVDNERNDFNKINDINLYYFPASVTNVDYVQLGYVNFNPLVLSG